MATDEPPDSATERARAQSVFRTTIRGTALIAAVSSAVTVIAGETLKWIGSGLAYLWHHLKIAISWVP